MSAPSATTPDAQAARDFRRVLGTVPTGVTLVASCRGDGRPVGMVVGTFTSVSLEPALVGFLADVGSRTGPRIVAAGGFCASVLAARQEDLARRMARVGGDERFVGVAWTSGPGGHPILDGAVSWLGCEVASVVRLGDHDLVVGRVTHLHARSHAQPLIFQRGEFGEFTSTTSWLLDEMLLR